MSGYYQGFLFISFIPKCQKPNLKSSELGPEFLNVILKLFKQFWVIGMFCKVNVVEDFLDCFRVKLSDELFSFL